MKKQLIPIVLSFTLFAIFSVSTYGILFGLNLFVSEPLKISIVITQFLLGIFIYLKTSVDYALFVGGLMEKNPGIKNRIAMNVGTQIGCFIGVTAIVVLWTFFREIHWLMAILLIVAGMILIGLGDGSQEHFESLPGWVKRPLEVFFNLTRPIVSLFTFFMPDSEMSPKAMSWGRLFFISGIIPFALGADDLAGYMVLLTATNVFSLLLGIYFGDAIIDIALFAKPEWTVAVVKNRWVSYLGAVFFVFLAVMSFIHAVSLFL